MAQPALSTSSTRASSTSVSTQPSFVIALVRLHEGHPLPLEPGEQSGPAQDSYSVAGHGDQALRLLLGHEAQGRIRYRLAKLELAPGIIIVGRQERI